MMFVSEVSVPLTMGDTAIVDYFWVPVRMAGDGNTSMPVVGARREERRATYTVDAPGRRCLSFKLRLPGDQE